MSAPAPQETTNVITHLSFSRLKELAHSPQALMAYLEKRKKATKSMDAGTLLDVLLFTPNELDEKFFVWPEDGPSKPTAAQRGAKKPAPETLAQIEQYDALMGMAEGKILVKPHELEQSNFLADAVRMSATVAEHGLLHPGNFSFQVEVEFTYGGFKHRGKADASGIRRDGKRTIWDLKRMGAKSGEREVRYQIRSMLYDLQAAIYCHPYDIAGEPVEYYIVAVSDEGYVTPFRISQDARNQARIHWNILIKKAHALNMLGHLDAGPEFWAGPESFFDF
jgi:hypothetical protein